MNTFIITYFVFVDIYNAYIYLHNKYKQILVCCDNYYSVLFCVGFLHAARYLAGGLRSNLLVPYERANALMFDYLGVVNSSQEI